MTARRKLTADWITLFIISGLYLYLLFRPELWETGLSLLFPEEQQVLYPRIPLSSLFLEHLFLVSISSTAAIILGITGGVFVTTKWGKDFRDLLYDVSSLSQTIPPVAVLALAVPFIGFGAEPTILALILYGILPVIRNTVSGVESVPEEVRQAAVAAGMTYPQRLFRVVLPLSLPVIIAGARISVVINVGTATIGAVVGAGGIGTIIMSGLVRENPAFILQGALSAAGFALILDRLLGLAQKTLFRSYAWNN